MQFPLLTAYYLLYLISRSFDILKTALTSFFLKATFDQDLFVNLGCNDTKPDAIIQPCCTETETSQCLNSTAVTRCIDSNLYKGNASSSESQYFMFNVANPYQCRSITIFAR